MSDFYDAIGERLERVVGGDETTVERLHRLVAVYEASLALRRSESRFALASDVIAEIEAERALTDKQVESRTQAALTRWRSIVDDAIETKERK